MITHIYLQYFLLIFEGIRLQKKKEKITFVNLAENSKRGKTT